MLWEEFIKIGSKYVETSRFRASDGGEALVLLHEGLGCVKLWGKFPSKLKEKFGLSVFLLLEIWVRAFEWDCAATLFGLPQGGGVRGFT